MDGTAQLVNVHIGQAGCQLGHAVWELFCLEHGVQADGRPAPNYDDLGRSSVFAPVGSGQHVAPRSILCDTDPTVIDEVRNGAYCRLFGGDCLVSANQSAAGNYAIGYNGVGRQLLEMVTEQLRRLLEACDRLEGCLLYHSLGGGTGSGFTTLLMETMRDDLRKSRIVQLAVYPSPRLATGAVEPYNTVAALHGQDGLTDGVLVLDNEAMYEILQRLLGGGSGADYTLGNRLAAQVASCLTAGVRFGGDLCARLADISTNLIPFPKLHLLVPSYAPIFRAGALSTTESGASLVEQAMSDGHAFAKVRAAGKRLLASCCLFRGDVAPADGNRWLQTRKTRGQLTFQSWLSTGVKVGYCRVPPVRVPGSGVGVGARALAVVSNTPAIVRKFRNLGRKFDAMFANRTHLWSFREHGYSEDNFEEARRTVADMEEEYLSQVDSKEEYAN